MKKILSLGFLVLLLSACGKPALTPMPSSGGPQRYGVPEKDRARFAGLKDGETTDREKRQVKFLKDYGHDLKWFDTTTTIVDHATVQLIFFNYEDQAVGLCSGALVGDNFVATAGHCFRHTPQLQKEGAACDGSVLVAYRATVTTPVEYFGCDTVVSYDLKMHLGVPDAKTLYELRDRALMKIRRPVAVGSLPHSMINSRQLLGEKATHVIPVNTPLTAVIVDPPKDSGVSFASAYRMVDVKTVDREKTCDEKRIGRHDALWAESSGPTFRPGNSGSPMYVRVGNKVVFSAKSAAYIAPLSALPPTFPTIVVTELPATFLSGWFRELLK